MQENQNTATSTVSIEPVLIHFDNTAFLAKKSEYEGKCFLLQQVVDLFNSLNLKRLDHTELELLFNDTINLVFDKMEAGEAFAKAGIAIEKHKAIEILKKPEGYEELLSTIASLKQSGTLSFVYNCELVNEIVILKKEFLDKLENQFKTFATTDRAKKVLNFANEVMASIDANDLREHFTSNPNGVHGIIRAIIDGGDGKPLKIDPKYIGRYNQPNYYADR